MLRAFIYLFIFQGEKMRGRVVFKKCIYYRKKGLDIQFVLSQWNFGGTNVCFFAIHKEKAVHWGRAALPTIILLHLPLLNIYYTYLGQIVWTVKIYMFYPSFKELHFYRKFELRALILWIWKTTQTLLSKFLYSYILSVKYSEYDYEVLYSFLYTVNAISVLKEYVYTPVWMCVKECLCSDSRMERHPSP